MCNPRFLFRCILIVLLAIFQLTSCLTFHRSLNDYDLSDSDKDGVPDNKDQCPLIAGKLNLAGCPDQDNDGIADEDDLCPDSIGLPENRGCPDRDGDGIPDRFDEHPDRKDEHIYKESLEKGDKTKPDLPHTVPDRDQDGDGINDSKDKCPDVFGTVENQGCPGTKIVDTEPKNDTPQNTDKKNDKSYVKNNANISKPTTNKPEETDQKEKSGIIAYCFHKEMFKGETKDLWVTLGINTTKPLVIKKVREAEAEQMELVKKYDTCEAHTIEITVYDSLTIKIEYDRSDFEIKAVKTTEKQKINSVSGNQWHWLLKAISEKPEATITLIIDGIKPTGEVCALPDKTIPIAIKINPKNISRKFISYLAEHPEYTIPSVIIPLLGFLYKLWVNRRKKKNQKAKD